MISRMLMRSKAFVTQIKGKEDLAKHAKGNYILNFYADWCGTCRAMEPITSKKEEQSQGKWVLLKANIDKEQNAQLKKQFNVQSIPTLIYFKDGKEVHRTVGGLNEEKFDAALKNIA